MILGITGGSGCGKTTLLGMVEEFGGLVLDCDAIYHDLLLRDSALLGAIEARFPGTVAGGALLRKKLGEIVFADSAALADLNGITHRAVKAEVLRRLSAPFSLAAVDAIGLFEGGLAELCDVTVAVTAPEEVRVARLMAREGISRDYALARIHAQKGDAFYRSRCDFTLENDGTREEFREKCRLFFRRLAIPGLSELPASGGRS